MNPVTKQALLALFGAVVVGCSGAPPDDGSPDYELTSKHDAPAMSAADTTTTPPPASKTDAGPAPTTAPPPVPPVPFAGTIAATTSSSYGGTPYCNYSVVLKNVTVAMTVLPSGALDTMTVDNTVVESAPGCPYAPSAPSHQVFTSSGATTSLGPLHVELTGSADNTPKASLVVDLVPNGTSYDATLTWKRTDQAAALDWSVTAATSLAPTR